jgi:hypothetical protein
MAERRQIGSLAQAEPIELVAQRAVLDGCAQIVLYARRNPTMKRNGMTPTLVLCSGNARPEKGLVRRPHLDQHECPSKRGKQTSLERLLIDRECARPMRVVEGGLGPSLSILGKRSRGRRKERREARQFPILAQRAVADSPRWTRARWKPPGRLSQCSDEALEEGLMDTPSVIDQYAPEKVQCPRRFLKPQVPELSIRRVNGSVPIRVINEIHRQGA